MKRRRSLPIALAALFVVGGAVRTAHAQCAFQHPKTAKRFQTSLVQAFTSCGPPNSQTEGNLPACKPPETFSQQAGNDVSGGWKWNPAKGSGKIEFKVVASCAAQESPGSLPKCDPSSPLNQGPPPSADLAIKLSLTSIVQGPGAGTSAANGTGTLSIIARATLEDRTNGDVTVVDFPASSPFTMQNGSATLKTSADAILNALNKPGLPPCTSIELVYASVYDPKGDAFARVGIYLPEP